MAEYDDDEAAAAASAAADLDAMFPGVSLVSLLLHPIDDYPHDSFSSSVTPNPKPEMNCLPMCPAPSTKPPIITTTTTRASARRTRNLLKQREQRRSISEKMKCLRKLMPWHRKRDHASLLEEAGNYILFLQAQLSSLMSMPMTMPMPFSPPPPLGIDSGTLNDVVHKFTLKQEDYSSSAYGIGSSGFPSTSAFAITLPPPLCSSNYYY